MTGTAGADVSIVYLVEVCGLLLAALVFFVACAVAWGRDAEDEMRSMMDEYHGRER